LNIAVAKTLYHQQVFRHVSSLTPGKSRITGDVVFGMGGWDAREKYRETPIAWFGIKMCKMFA